MEELELSKGDSVVFVKCHPAHNPYLRKQVGQTGNVLCVGENFRGKEALVDFGVFDNYWINYKYLKKVYAYGMRFRALGIGCQPLGHLWYRDDNKRKTGFYGIVTYEQPLTDEQCKQYELTPIAP